MQAKAFIVFIEWQRYIKSLCNLIAKALNFTIDTNSRYNLINSFQVKS